MKANYNKETNQFELEDGCVWTPDKMAAYHNAIIEMLLHIAEERNELKSYKAKFLVARAWIKTHCK